MWVSIGRKGKILELLIAIIMSGIQPAWSLRQPVSLSDHNGVEGVVWYQFSSIGSTRFTAHMRLYPFSLRDPSGDKVVAFLAVEAKENAGRFEAHLPKVVLELVACAKQLQ